MRKLTLLEVATTINIAILLVYFFLPNISKWVLLIPVVSAAISYLFRRD